MTLGRAYNEAGRSKDAAERFRIARALKLEGAPLLNEEEARLADQESGPAPDEQVDQIEALLQLARALQDAGDTDGAEQALGQAILEAPADWRPHHDLGLLYLRTGRLRPARQALSEADRLAPPGETSPAMNLVVVTLYEGDYRAAVAAYEDLAGPTLDPILATNIGTAYYSLGDLDRAEEFYRLAIKLQPGNEVFRGNLGDLLLKRGEPDLALSAYSVALSLLDEQLAVFPDKPILKTYKALYLAKVGRCEEALPIALRSETLGSGSVEAPLLSARALALCNAPQEAISLLAQARAIGLPLQMIVDEADFASLRTRPAFRALVDSNR
jgi:Flp pilus assembly protein TadD